MYSRIKLIHFLTFIWIAIVLLTSLVTVAKELSIYEFDHLLKTEKYLFVLFQSSESCKRCSQVLFTWQLLKKQILSRSIPKLVIGQVDCSIHRDLCSREDIKELPSIKLYIAINQITQKEVSYDSYDYDLNSLENFLTSKIKIESQQQQQNSDEDSDGVLDNSDLGGFTIVSLKPNNGLYELTDDDSSLFLSQGQHFVNFYTPWCSHCQNLKPKWELIAKSLENNERVKVSQIDCSTNIYTCKMQFKIKEYPTLLWVSNGKVIARYKGSHELENLKSFINSQLTDFELNKLLKKYSDADAGIEEVEIDYRKKTSSVRSLNSDNFKTSIEFGTTFVHFTVPWSKHCRQMKPEWDKLSLRVQQNIKIAKVDCSTNEKLCSQEKIDAYPTLLLFKNGKRYIEYDGLRTVDAFVQYLNQQQLLVNDEYKDEL